MNIFLNRNVYKYNSIFHKINNSLNFLSNFYVSKKINILLSHHNYFYILLLFINSFYTHIFLPTDIVLYMLKSLVKRLYILHTNGAQMASLFTCVCQKFTNKIYKHCNVPNLYIKKFATPVCNTWLLAPVTFMLYNIKI